MRQMCPSLEYIIIIIKYIYIAIYLNRILYGLLLGIILIQYNFTTRFKGEKILYMMSLMACV